MTKLVASDKPLAFYLHVPYCSRRCGYCDFNTYTNSEFETGIGQGSWLESVKQEIDLAAETLESAPEIDTVFFGGGTPTLLPASDLAAALDHLHQSFGLATNGEVTTESNPDSVNVEYLDALLAGGFTRISFGMQSASERILKLLDRTHQPGRSVEVAMQAKRAGFSHVNLDLIYGTPSETVTELRESVQAAISAGIDHLSAYALTIEEGTKLGKAKQLGKFPNTSEDDLAEKYEILDAELGAAGFNWYEISNWALPNGESRHNRHYWRSHNWWGIGPGAHSHISGTRFFNVKHPTEWTKRLRSGQLPWHESEVLTSEDLAIEKLMLRLRMREGLHASELDSQIAARLTDEGLFDSQQMQDGRAVLTLRGRLLADYVVRELT